ncbi:MAG: pyruvate formate-lyase 1-activating enzyme [Actinobacteria bacterium HGW-Actinobacteria-2]|nr:MAG: pyruvate formate-lyase 1-activating enzyme [Actinobacteria bacterium HGW-Actinobacteria-2]
MLGGIPTAEHLSRAELLVGQRTGEVGLVHSWELVTAVDGPGTRMTTFLAGCPLRCLYCHNPDTFSARGGVPVLAEDLLAQIRRYRGIFAATGGGITLSGGEALAQPAFVRTVVRAAREWGVHVTLDTSGFLGRNCDDDLLADVDLVLLDVKAGDEPTYHRITGGRLAPTLDFGRRVAAAGVELWIRFVLVPGLTDAPETVAAVADYAASLSTVTRVEVLGFHQLGRDKWAELGLDYQLTDTPTPTAAELAAVRAVFTDRGLTTY